MHRRQKPGGHPGNAYMNDKKHLSLRKDCHTWLLSATGVAHTVSFATRSLRRLSLELAHAPRMLHTVKLLQSKNDGKAHSLTTNSPVAGKVPEDHGLGERTGRGNAFEGGHTWFSFSAFFGFPRGGSRPTSRNSRKYPGFFAPTMRVCYIST